MNFSPSNKAFETSTIPVCTAIVEEGLAVFLGLCCADLGASGRVDVKADAVAVVNAEVAMFST